jgi:hypothetical protein
MASSADSCEPRASADYRRKARRLRRVYADRPVQLYRRLAELGQMAGEVPPVPPPAECQRVYAFASPKGTHPFAKGCVPFGLARAAAMGARAGIPAHATPNVSHFAQLVALQLEGPILRYSRRLALLRVAEQMNIGRFEANLIIALIQHRLNTGEIQPAIEIEPVQAKPSLYSRLLPLTTFALLQSAIIWGIWRLFA